MGVTTWTIKELKALHKERAKGISWEYVGNNVGRSRNSCSKKYKRMDWDAFLKDPSSYNENNTLLSSSCNRWIATEMAQLDAYLQAGKSYAFIADKLGRGIIAVERQAQITDWKAWRELDHKEIETQEKIKVETDKEAEKEEFHSQLINALLTICRHNLDRLNQITQKEFVERVNLEEDRLKISFSELKVLANEELERQGFGNPENLKLGKGTYVIVGDSHGKHTKKSMFALLKNVNKHIKPDKIIHIGHILDDDNDISYNWGDFDNLIVVTKIDELRVVQDQRNKFNFNYKIIREMITLGKDLLVFNQDMISDYVATPLQRLDTNIFDEKVITNCHRLEYSPRCSNEGASYFVSPGCICEKHIIRTVKQIDFTDGKTVKQAYWEGFSKYRRMRHTNQYWETGILVVHIDEKGDDTIIPCVIKKTIKGYTTSYFDKMISSKGVFNPDKKIFINADLHCDKHDANVLDIQESVCKDYRPDAYVNLGDTLNYASLNHHIMDRGGVILNKTVLDEAASTYAVLKRCSLWAKDIYLIYGNHERFANDFTEKYPQLENYLDLKFLCDLEELGYKLTELKDVLKIGPTKFIHGEIRMYNQAGSKIEKASRTFGNDVFIGHIHTPALRFGCCSIGLTGQLDQDYNEPEASSWIHGFGLCNQYKGKSWPTTIAIIKNKVIINNKTYLPKNPDSWNISKYNVKLTYDLD